MKKSMLTLILFYTCTALFAFNFSECGQQHVTFPSNDNNYFLNLYQDLNLIGKGIETHGECLNTPVFIPNDQRVANISLSAIDIPVNDTELLKSIKAYASLTLVSGGLNQYLEVDRLHHNQRRLCIKFTSETKKRNLVILQEILKPNNTLLKNVDIKDCM